MVGNVLSFLFSLAYIVSSYYIYRNLIYPVLIRNYHEIWEIAGFESFKKDMRYLGSMTLGWLIVIGWWIVYLSTFILVAKTGGTETVSVTFLNISGSIFILSMFATSWPKPIGRFIVEK